MFSEDGQAPSRAGGGNAAPPCAAGELTLRATHCIYGYGPPRYERSGP